MNKQQRQQYWQKHNRRIKIFERRYLRRVHEVLQSQMAQAANILRSSGPDGLEMKLPSLMFNETLVPVLEDLYKEAGLYFARRTMRQINASARKPDIKAAGFGFDEKWNQDIIDYLRENLLKKAVVPIQNTTKAQVMLILERGRTEGWSVDRMAFELEKSELTLSRARLIVRTELLMAEHIGKELAREDTEFETDEIWVSADDHRVRHSHRQIDGESVPTGGRFRVNRYRGKKLIGFDMMTGPGDPTASAENICNCRCSSVVRARRDEEGKLIRKRKIFVALPGEIRRDRTVVTI
jgi:hypothetical protein